MVMAVALWCFYHALGGRKLRKTERWTFERALGLGSGLQALGLGDSRAQSPKSKA
jgi:hypothetical protein